MCVFFGDSLAIDLSLPLLQIKLIQRPVAVRLLLAWQMLLVRMRSRSPSPARTPPAAARPIRTNRRRARSGCTVAARPCRRRPVPTTRRPAPTTTTTRTRHPLLQPLPPLLPQRRRNASSRSFGPRATRCRRMPKESSSRRQVFQLLFSRKHASFYNSHIGCRAISNRKSLVCVICCPNACSRIVSIRAQFSIPPPPTSQRPCMRRSKRPTHCANANAARVRCAYYPHAIYFGGGRFTRHGMLCDVFYSKLSFEISPMNVSITLSPFSYFLSGGRGDACRQADLEIHTDCESSHWRGMASQSVFSSSSSGFLRLCCCSHGPPISFPNLSLSSQYQCAENTIPLICPFSFSCAGASHDR